MITLNIMSHLIWNNKQKVLVQK